MTRLLEIQNAPGCPRRLTIEVGDVLQFAASGGHVRSGAAIVEVLGPLLPAVLADEGDAASSPSADILSPAGPPTTILFVARHPGRATIDVVTGDPWRAAQTTTVIDIKVREPSGGVRASPRQP